MPRTYNSPLPRDPEDPRSDVDMQDEHDAQLAWNKERPMEPHWRDKPPTHQQRHAALKHNLTPVNETRGAYSDAIKAFHDRGAR